MKIFRGLIFDKGQQVISKGMVILWIVFGVLVAYWIKIYMGETIAIPDSLTTITQTLLVYNFGKKLVPQKQEEKQEEDL